VTQLKRKTEKMDLKKRKEDFSPLTALTVEMDLWTMVAHNYYKGMILNEIDVKIVAAEAATATPPPEAAAAPAGASATTSGSTPTSTSASVSATE
jgi:hypothetical protein